LVVSAALPDDTVVAIREQLRALHTTPEGRELLALGKLERFAAVTDSDYDPIRQMDSVAAGITL
jgi:phosphonate transport system substrate-binding protein